MIVEGRRVEVLRRGKLSHLLLPRGATFVLDEYCQCIEWVGGHLDSETIGLHELAPAWTCLPYNCSTLSVWSRKGIFGGAAVIAGGNAYFGGVFILGLILRLLPCRGNPFAAHGTGTRELGSQPHL